MKKNLGNATECSCKKTNHDTKLLVLTGGPGAGKTAILELARRYFCEHIAVLPEAASILYAGGFWRGKSQPAVEAAQRAIFHVQREQERMVLEEKKYSLVLCDRGVIDGSAYWPGTEKSFYDALQTTRDNELKHYASVICLRTPSSEHDYNQRNPTRIESPEEAQALDQKTLHAWRGHPNMTVVESTKDFFEKIVATMLQIQNEVPDCCKAHLEHHQLHQLAAG